ncbi:DUF6931 family protein [Lignipirellula cremea]|uniref:Uncharacterized protein n=1 Tax=Lignipirellula cremea TaxID=2528010 RepID=A0A518DTG2_9BACT|nr:hypothetical protein [Lignipirellula cremea]QDU95132.1 hypothetical protein Pla8534_29440 [Lignipirellula cremea]
MTTATMAKPPRKTESVAEITARYKIGEEAAAFLAKSETPSAFLEKCLEQKLVVDAAQFLTYWLPPKKAVWWCVLDFWWTHREQPTPETAALLDGIVRWLQEPTDEMRRDIRDVGRRPDCENAVKFLCNAVFFSEGSMNRADRQHVDPPAAMCNTQVFAALKNLARTQPREDREFFWRQILHIGLEVRQDKNDWILAE